MNNFFEFVVSVKKDFLSIKFVTRNSNDITMISRWVGDKQQEIVYG